MLPTTELSVPQLYAMDLEPPPKIDELIAAAYDILLTRYYTNLLP